MKPFAITGVTGNIGRIALEHLLARVPPENLVAIARRPERAGHFAARGVEVRHGDYEDVSSLDQALAGVENLLFVSGSDRSPGARTRQHAQVIDRALRAKVRRVVYTSMTGAITGAGNGEGITAEHAETEVRLRESGLGFTILRNALYSEAFIATALAQAKASGEITSSTGPGRLNSASLRDLAEAASLALTRQDQEGTVHELLGTPWSYPELAEALTEALGRPIAYRLVPDSETGMFAELFPLVRAGAFSQGGPDLEKLLGRPASGLLEVIRRLLNAPER